MISATIDRLSQGKHLRRAEARELALAILGDEVPDCAIAGLLVALKAKGETAEEVAGFADGMRTMKVSLSPGAGRLVDTCGTGGDGKGTFNVSTAAAIIAAGAGVRVAKHGNRGISSGCGSADVLDRLGVDITMSPEKVCRAIDEIGIGFLFAPTFHPAMKRVAGVRKELGVPTIFNILGPLTNPAGARAQVLGVSKQELVSLMGTVLRDLGCERAFVLHGADGMDEFTLTAKTHVCEVRAETVSEYSVAPEDLGLPRAGLEGLKGGDADVNARIIRELLEGRPGPPLDIAVANASFAVVASGLASSLTEGTMLAKRSVESGGALAVLERLVAYSMEARE